MIQQLTPREALRLAGKHDWWVRRQMGIRHKSTFSRLVSGQRPRSWTPDRRRAFALALGIPESAISFVPRVHISGTPASRDSNTSPAEALDSSPERDDAPSEYSDTCTPGKAPQSAKSAAGESPAAEAA